MARKTGRLYDSANEANIHPVHLSREFSRHFHTHLGDYLRLVKVQRAMTLLGEPERLLTEIAFECGFADQSHFIRSFRAYYGMTPLEYRRLMRGDVKNILFFLRGAV